MIAWDKGYSVGIPAIDEQHLALVETLGKLEGAIAKGAGKEAVRDIGTFLSQYVYSHFRTEEALLAMHGYPDLAAHKEHHRHLTNQVQTILTRVEMNQLPPEESVEQFLSGWLTEHILKEDHIYAAYLHSHSIL